MADRRIQVDDEGRPIKPIDGFTAADAKQLAESFAAGEELNTKAEVLKILAHLRARATAGAREENIYPEKENRTIPIRTQLQNRGFSVNVVTDPRDGSHHLHVTW